MHCLDLDKTYKVICILLDDRRTSRVINGTLDHCILYLEKLKLEIKDLLDGEK